MCLTADLSPPSVKLWRKGRLAGGLMSWPRVNVTRGSISDPSMEGEPSYAMGYSAAARPKRVIHSLIASALGVGVGLFVRQVIINPNNPYKY